MKYLLISEKPSLMRVVQSAFYKANLNFDVDFIALHGHCCTLCSPGDYDEKYDKWNMSDLPIIPNNFKHKPVDTELVEKIDRTIKNNNYDGLINCTDAEREGQNIFYSLYDYLQLNLPVKRFWASDLTEPKLIEAWNNLKDDLNEPFLKNLTEASLNRAIMDWLVGMNFSRAISIATKQNIPIGRVMTVVLSILAKREIEIKNFVPSKSYKLMVDYVEGFSGELKGDAFTSKEECDLLAKTVSNKLKVVEANNKTTANKAPLLFSLGDLQNEANKTFGYTLDKTLSIAQSLYEMKITSYPRVDTQYLSDGEAKRMSIIINACKKIPGLAKYKIDENKVKNYPKSKYADDSKIKGHYAIVLTGYPFEFDKLSKEQQNVLTLIAKRIMATCMDDSKTCETNILVQDGDKTFVTNEKVLVYAGYKELYDEEVKSVKLDKIKTGQLLEKKKAYSKEVTTTCPPRYNDASINKAMINVGNLIEDKELASALEGKTKDQGGIGTPATRAGIIEKLLDDKKGWVIRKGKSFIVTDKGLEIYEKVKKYKVSSPELTAEWENKLKKVEEGEMDSNELLPQVKDFITQEVSKFLNEKSSSSTSLVCPICNSPINESAKYYYCSKYKNPCNFIVAKETSGALINNEDMKKICEGKETDIKTFKSKEGKKFEASLKLEDNKLRFIFNKQDNSVNIICNCGQNIKKLSGKFGNFYKCEGCNTTVSEMFMGHKFNQKEVKKLFERKEVPVNGLVSKAGKNFNAVLEIEDNKVSIKSFIN